MSERSFSLSRLATEAVENHAVLPAAVRIDALVQTTAPPRKNKKKMSQLFVCGVPHPLSSLHSKNVKNHRSCPDTPHPDSVSPPSLVSPSSPPPSS